MFRDDVKAAIHYAVREQGEAMVVPVDRAAIARMEAEFESEVGAASASERSNAKYLARAMPLPAP